MRTTIAAVVFATLASTAPLATPHDGAVTFIGADEVTAAFAKGRPLTETVNYKIHASRREAGGMAEVHVRDTNLIYVLEGSATLVTGGRVVAPKTVAEDEIRGTAVEGGETRALVKGDVLVVPNGVPHWFRQVDGPFLYYVVKVTAPTGGRP